MKYFFDGTVTNKLEKHPDISVTVFNKKEDRWEKLLDPLWVSDSGKIPQVETWKNAVSISVCLNEPIGDDKVCTVAKIENGKSDGPKQVGNFKWELEITSTKDETSEPRTTIEIEVTGK